MKTQSSFILLIIAFLTCCTSSNIEEVKKPIESKILKIGKDKYSIMYGIINVENDFGCKLNGYDMSNIIYNEKKEPGQFVEYPKSFDYKKYNLKYPGDLYIIPVKGGRVHLDFVSCSTLFNLGPNRTEVYKIDKNIYIPEGKFIFFGKINIDKTPPPLSEYIGMEAINYKISIDHDDDTPAKVIQIMFNPKNDAPVIE